MLDVPLFYEIKERKGMDLVRGFPGGVPGSLQFHNFWNSLENQTFVKGFLIYCVPYKTTKCIPLILEFVL